MHSHSRIQDKAVPQVVVRGIRCGVTVNGKYSCFLCHCSTFISPCLSFLRSYLFWPSFLYQALSRFLLNSVDRCLDCCDFEFFIHYFLYLRICGPPMWTERLYEVRTSGEQVFYSVYAGPLILGSFGSFVDGPDSRG